jgi:1,4-alpha-glucan branching enzyme
MGDPREEWLRLLVPAIVRRDSWLEPYVDKIRGRASAIRETAQRLKGSVERIADFALGHEYFGIHKTRDGWVLREWAPNATAIFIKGMFNDWRDDQPEYLFKKITQDGIWELKLPAKALNHGDLYRLIMCWNGGREERIPAWARRVVQDQHTKIFNAQIWFPPEPYQWQIPHFIRAFNAPIIYEAHVGMAQEDGKVGTFNEFREHVLPRIVEAGYNTIQLMAIQEHPYYGSFGYHVSSFFAASSRFGTPEELKALIDAAHEAGIAVIMDIVHSHAVKNEVEGISKYDGTYHQFFHAGARGNHTAWDSRCFDYSKDKVLLFLLSNCRYWLEEFKFDGFRFDGVTSMLYLDHGLGKAFAGYDDYFTGNVDEDALVYLALANQVVHSIRPDALTIAEDVSGMPGLAAPITDGGVGFDYRLAMGVPDYWIKLIKENPDERWHVGYIWHQLTNKRQDEFTVSYAESHDQALVGDKTVIFRLIDKDMYYDMAKDKHNMTIDRGMALHKMIRLITLATSGGAYLNFMGNEFGHPEWIDFPREGNGWSYHYARRQWHLMDDPKLKYHYLADFDKAMIEIAKHCKLLESAAPKIMTEHIDDHVLAFERADLLFVFNFDPGRSFTDYQIKSRSGRYRQILDSDSGEFGGFARLVPDQVHFAKPGYHGDGGTPCISLYLPNRSAQVFERI